ncbi:hypothetical protein LguiA_021598 [Lonicera macranthoides]
MARETFRYSSGDGLRKHFPTLGGKEGHMTLKLICRKVQVWLHNNIACYEAGPWTKEEDSILTRFISLHGQPLRSSLELPRSFCRWSKIAQHLPGRTDNDIKNYWRTRVQKQAKQLNCHVNSQQFRDAIRHLLLPRLVQQIHQSSSFSQEYPTLITNPTVITRTNYAITDQVEYLQTEPSNLVPADESAILLELDEPPQSPVVLMNHEQVFGYLNSCSSSSLDRQIDYKKWSSNIGILTAAANFLNTAPHEIGSIGEQAVALRISGSKAAFYNCSFYGAQDTLYDHKGLRYFNNCFIQGSVDFIFGYGRSLYENCWLNSISKKVASVTTQKRSISSMWSGFSFKDSKVTGSGKVYLGRAWGDYSRVVFSYTYLDQIVLPQGWSDWGNQSRDAKYQILPRNQSQIQHLWRDFHYSGIFSDEWNETAILSFLDIYESKWSLRNRAKLKGSDWEEIGRQVSARTSPAVKNPNQCKNKIESMKKKYWLESAAAASKNSNLPSS